ncbi:hypothetical protein [Tardiphaga sp. OK245]|uniref:hypothetical protein n=1 Tax=Tardiphaga sp. OK245 TaxID=1855306 RepID=UPI001FCCC846|nr:hypothetical protein [Tardiphaga sp. OK245]
MRIDEAGRYQLAARVDDAGILACIELPFGTYRRNSPIDNQNVGDGRPVEFAIRIEYAATCNEGSLHLAHADCPCGLRKNAACSSPLTDTSSRQRPSPAAKHRVAPRGMERPISCRT